MKYAINFSDEHFRLYQKYNTFTAKKIAGFDEVFSFTEKDIDKEFILKNKNIFQNRKGFGYWIWKPYFIDKVLHLTNEGSYIFYCDSGSIYINKVQHLIKQMNIDKIDIMLFELPLLEDEWTNNYTLNNFNMYNDNVRFSNQYIGGYILLRNSNKSKLFIKEYLTYCQNESILTDIKNDKNDRFTISHRHDQSILSLHAKKTGVVAYKDPSDYGEFPHKYLSYNQLFRLKKYKKHYPTIILANRKEHPVKYLVKYLIKRLINNKFNS